MLCKMIRPISLLWLRGNHFKHYELKKISLEGFAGPSIAHMTIDDEMFEGWAAQEAGGRLSPWSYPAKPLGPDDIEIEVLANGVCHTDCHMVNNDWGITTYPLIPGHEVIGRVTKMGSNVTHLKVGDRVGYGWLVGSCGSCMDCLKGEENLCVKGYQGTILGTNHGGFQKRMRASSHFAYKVPDAITNEDAAPLMCAGITVYTPLRENITAPGMKVAVMAIGGLGHLALQFANKMGAEVTALSHSPSKKEEAHSLGAHHYLITKDALETHRGAFDIIVNTAPVPIDIDLLLDLLAPGGKLVYVGLPATSLEFNVCKLVFGGKSIVGSIVGGRRFTAEMLDFAALHGIKPMVERMRLDQVNEAFERVLANKVRYRVVLQPDDLPPVKAEAA